MLRLRLIAAVSLVLTTSGTLYALQPSIEYDVKAAFVLNFARYVEWPAEQRTAPFRICLLREDPFGGRLENVVAGERWHGGPIDVRVIPELREPSDCHLLYVPASAVARFAGTAAAMSAWPVLVVGENDRFLEQGGMIRLFVEENRVRFAINQRAAEAAGLQVSSRLLRLAKNVLGARGPGE